MKTLIYMFFFLLSGSILFGCKKNEEKLTPSDISVPYQLPQGNNAFDATIVDFNKRFGTFFLYKFNAVDFGATPVYATSNFGDLYTINIADEAYVGKVLAFVQKNWLNHYPDPFLKQYLPYKILLGNDMRSKTSPNTKYSVLPSYNHMALSNFSSTFDAMTAAAKKTFVNTIHVEFFNFMNNRGKLDIPAEFTTVTNYTQTGITATNFHTFGYVNYLVSLQDNKPVRDFLSYIALITSRTKAELDVSILAPTTDTNGLVKRKYDIIINYYKTKYNVDLQAIGNAGVIN